MIAIAEMHRAWTAMTGKQQEAALPDNDLLDAYFRLDDDADRGLAFVLLCAARCDDPAYLALTAAGPLEDLLQPGADAILLARVRAEAHRTPRFRWMLGHVYEHAVDQAIAPLVCEAALASLDNDALPPAPQR